MNTQFIVLQLNCCMFFEAMFGIVSKGLCFFSKFYYNLINQTMSDKSTVLTCTNRFIDRHLFLSWMFKIQFPHTNNDTYQRYINFNILDKISDWLFTFRFWVKWNHVCNDIIFNYFSFWYYNILGGSMVIHSLYKLNRNILKELF